MTPFERIPGCAPVRGNNCSQVFVIKICLFHGCGGISHIGGFTRSHKQLSWILV